MQIMRFRFIAVALIGTFGLACAAPSQTSSQPGAIGETRPNMLPNLPSISGRTMTMAVGRAPESLGSRPLRELRGPGNRYRLGFEQLRICGRNYCIDEFPHSPTAPGNSEHRWRVRDEIQRRGRWPDLLHLHRTSSCRGRRGRPSWERLHNGICD